MKAKAFLGARILLGLGFTIFGLNGFLQFMPMPPLPPEAGQFMGALAMTGYFFPVLKLVEVVAGVMLLANRYVPLALILLAPILVQINLFHLFLAPEGTPMGAILGFLAVAVAWDHCDAFKGVLAAKSVTCSSKECK